MTQRSTSAAPNRFAGERGTCMEPVKVGLLGLGTVGGGTVTVLSRNAAEIARRAGRGIEIAHARPAGTMIRSAIEGLERSGGSATTPSRWSTTPRSRSSSS
jgi:homoserine dehydrogenase